MQKILTIVGAPPQFIKASVVSRAIAQTDGNEDVMLHTGQHFDVNISDVFFNQLGIPKPDIQLDIHGGTHGDMTDRMLVEIERALIEHKPERVLVYGDTNSMLSGALAAAKLHTPVAHVEAGLSSFNMKIPEEINRILMDQISDLLFCPTDTAVKNLNKEVFFFGKACVTMRDQTEWVVLIEVGANELVGADTQKIIAAAKNSLGRQVKDTQHLYGGGKAAQRIIDEICKVGI
jgi:UDP-N-acetylglucosamine 2-epimerase